MLAVDPTSPSTVYSLVAVYSAEGVTTSAFSSPTQGRGWNEIGRASDSFRITALAVDTTSPSTLYAATTAFDSKGQPSPPGIVYKTNDRGHSWTLMKIFSDDVVETLATDPRFPGSLYAGGWTNPCGLVPCYRGVLYRSLDLAVSWTEIDDGLPSPVSQVIVDPIRPGVLFAASRGVFKSNDNGQTWASFSAGLESCSLSVEAIAVDPHDSDILFAAVYQAAFNDVGCKRVFKSTDGGASWKMTSLGGYHVGSLVIDPVHPNVVYAGAERDLQFFSPPPGLFRTSDGGATWSPFVAGFPPLLGINGLAIDPSGLLIHAATNSGVFEYQLGVVPRNVPFR